MIFFRLFVFNSKTLQPGLLTTFQAEPEMENLVKDRDYSRTLSVERWELNRGEVQERIQPYFVRKLSIVY